ncbi:MAG: hypothetical protein U1E31_02350 [Rickettsiales bacterium]
MRNISDEQLEAQKNIRSDFASRLKELTSITEFIKEEFISYLKENISTNDLNKIKILISDFNLDYLLYHLNNLLRLNPNQTFAERAKSEAILLEELFQAKLDKIKSEIEIKDALKNKFTFFLKNKDLDIKINHSIINSIYLEFLKQFTKQENFQTLKQLQEKILDTLIEEEKILNELFEKELSKYFENQKELNKPINLHNKAVSNIYRKTFSEKANQKLPMLLQEMQKAKQKAQIANLNIENSDFTDDNSDQIENSNFIGDNSNKNDNIKTLGSGDPME